MPCTAFTVVGAAILPVRLVVVRMARFLLIFSMALSLAVSWSVVFVMLVLRLVRRVGVAALRLGRRVLVDGGMRVIVGHGRPLYQEGQ